MDFGKEGPTLFRQITGRLALILVVFALIDTGLVFWDYASEADGLAEDLVDMQAGRLFVTPADQISQLSPPPGVAGWTASVSATPPHSPSWSLADGETLLSSTQRVQTAQGVRISGIRNLGAGSSSRWIRTSFIVTSWRAYTPAVIKELGDHVVSPLIPLILIMAVFTITVVRRLLMPLRRAVREADLLKATPAGQRLSVPSAPREVRALVDGFNGALDRIDSAIGKLNQFTAQVAHELRTPIAILRLAVDEVQPPALRARLQDDLVGMTRLVNQMLDLAKADSLGPPTHETLDLGSVARDVVVRYTPLIHQRQSEIRFHDLQGDQSLIGDAAALGRALINLIDNAMKYGGVPGLIDITVGPGPKISVRDHGPGIDPADLDQVFKRFWRKADPLEPGAGLGLEIVRTITAYHRGVVTVANAPDGGAIFTMDFLA
jgi:signal transduction histidine kinase